jgi:hypothetical protein
MESKADELASLAKEYRDIHRIGGADIANLRLKPREKKLPLPGISVLQCDSADEAANQLRAAFPKADALSETAKTVASTTIRLIREAGFDILYMPSKNLPNHYRIVHPLGAAGFSDENLARLATVFETSTGHE